MKQKEKRRTGYFPRLSAIPLSRRACGSTDSMSADVGEKNHDFRRHSITYASHLPSLRLVFQWYFLNVG